ARPGGPLGAHRARPHPGTPEQARGGGHLPPHARGDVGRLARLRAAPRRGPPGTRSPGASPCPPATLLVMAPPTDPDGTPWVDRCSDSRRSWADEAVRKVIADAN